MYMGFSTRVIVVMTIVFCMIVMIIVLVIFMVAVMIIIVIVFVRMVVAFGFILHLSSVRHNLGGGCRRKNRETMTNCRKPFAPAVVLAVLCMTAGCNHFPSLKIEILDD